MLDGVLGRTSVPVEGGDPGRTSIPVGGGDLVEGGEHLPTIDAIRTTPSRQICSSGFEMLMATGRIGAKEEGATADVVAANLPDLAGVEDPAMSLDLQAWRSSDRVEMGDLDFALT
jgi:hypothetical protein